MKAEWAVREAGPGSTRRRAQHLEAIRCGAKGGTPHAEFGGLTHEHGAAGDEGQQADVDQNNRKQNFEKRESSASMGMHGRQAMQNEARCVIVSSPPPPECRRVGNAVRQRCFVTLIWTFVSPDPFSDPSILADDCDIVPV